MTHESPRSPQDQGFSPEQEQAAAHLTQKYREASQARSERQPLGVHKSPKENFAVWLAGPVLRAVDSMAETRLARVEEKAGKAAKEHYQEHESAYHEQALKMDRRRTETKKRMDQLLNASPEETGTIAALMGYSPREQQTLVQHTAERQTAGKVNDNEREKGIAALEKVPGIDPVLAIADGKPEEIPEEGWLVTSHIAPGYGGKITVYRYGKGQIEFKPPSDSREKYGEVRVHFGIKGGYGHTLAYENPEFPNKDTEPYDRVSPTSYTGLGFDRTDIVPLSNGGRLLDEKGAMGEHGLNLFTSMDWRDFDRGSMREHSSDFPVNRVVADQEALGPVLTGLGAGMGLEAQDIEVLTGTLDSKISTVQ